MSNHTSIEQFTQRVLKSYSNFENKRLEKLVQSLIKHLFSYIKENHISNEEWEFTWSFFAEMADFTNEQRNEFLLLADVLGISQLITRLNSNRPENVVGTALVGPFYRANAPLYEKGKSIIIDQHPDDHRVSISGKVMDMNKQPIVNAHLDVWQAASNGFYENQDPNQSEMNLRGKFKTDKMGNYNLIALMPTHYPIPCDGPVGKFLEAAKRKYYRPAHIHFIVSAPGFETLVTQLFMAGDKQINEDVVFTADSSMTGNFVKEQEGKFSLLYDFQLVPGKSIYPKATCI
ncbi:dioxygenase [Xanthovirga aplysinae]|uniref:dioxygenase family protein n=1 Tax=Xanthovirga aplysinae TaxID=2529853 RepID=UPI0012BBEB55|nr:dioxygenase [Xanthovirga aplysinae]MTI30718.1 protocatechuate 3,4-dioxygenase [Xanthovirga aplysinae]